MKKITYILSFFLSVLAYGQDISMQNGTFNQCEGRFFDSGGEFGPYSSDEDLSITLCPENAGDAIQLSFIPSTFSTQLNLDYMIIYDGPDNSAPSFGTFSGANNPGVIEATSPSGCLTIEFVSNGSGTTTGWAADIACLTPCQNIVANLDSTNPALDVNNIVVADVDEVITFNGSGNFSFDGSGATYLWDFGDGTTGTGASTTHQYDTAGLYDVTLVITDTNPAGCSSTNDIDLTAQIGASGPGNPFVEAGDNVVIDCADDCAEINAEFLEIGETNTYTVTEIPFVPPFPFQGLSNSLNTNIDDAWSAVDDLPFDFCFFTDIRTQFQVGSNGVIRFDIDASDTYNDYGFDQSLPNNADEALSEPNVFSPLHDIDPSVGNAEEIAWEIIGTAPNRVLAVSFYQVPMYSPACNNLLATHMAVFYETTNVIDIYIQDAPAGCGFNNGNKVVGIQNDAGTIAFVPPGRNTGAWGTSDEAWRFTPAGPSIIDFAWLDEAGNIIDTTPTLQVCPTDPTTYTARVTYTNCNGDEVVVTDDVTVSKDIPFTIDLGEDQNLCEGDPDVVLDADIGSETATYQWFLDGFLITGETDSSLVIASPDSGIYSAEVTDESCTLLEDVEIIFNPIPDPSFTLDASCVGATATVTGDTGGTFAFNPIPTDGALIDSTTGEVTNGVPGTNYVVEYVFSGLCPSSSSQEFTVEDLDDTSFTVDPSCFGATASIVGTTGGTFSFNPDPGDGAVIDANSGTVTGGTLGIVYNVEYSTTGVCGSSTNQSFSIIPADDPSFSLQANCTGATATLTGDTGGTFAFVAYPADGSVIDPATGTITNGVPDTTYTVEYTTAGPCVQTAQETVTIFSAEDASFTYTPDCDGAIASIQGDTGGTFSFNTDPGSEPFGEALVDPITGELSNVIPGASYNVDYTTAGNCPDTQTVLVTIFNQDDSSFSLFPTCDGATASVTGLEGGNFAFDSAPLDGATIDAVTGTITNGDYESSYSVSYTTNGNCPTTTVQTVTVFAQPDLTAPTPLEVCDDGTPDGITLIDLSLKNTEITGGNPSYTVSYHLTSSDAQNGVGALEIPYQNESNGQTVYVRVEDSVTGCSDTTELLLTVEQAPVANAPSPLEFCDPDSDGFGTFDLTMSDDEITGGDAGLEVTYHETSADAQNGVNAVVSPYSNIVINTQTLYVRVESGTIATDCASFTQLQLVVSPTPQLGATPPTPLGVCDDASGDGIAQFDLTVKEEEILQNLDDQTLYTVSYYLNATDANVPQNAILNPFNYTNIEPFSQTLVVRVEDNATGCYKLTALELVVNGLPELTQPAPLELCDYVSPGDEVEGFTLEDATDTILGGQTGISLSFHATQAGADTGTDVITSPYQNTENAQTVYVLATDDVTGCTSTVTLLLRVNPIPSPIAPMDIEVCDGDNDGFASFDLEQRTDAIIGGEADVEVTYHETQGDADSGENPLVSPYENIVMDEQVVYVRAENTVTGCYSASRTLTLRVLGSPEVPLEIEDYVICDTDANGFAQFDLTTKNAEILGGQSATDYILTYHVSAAAAQTGSAPIANVLAYTNTSNPQTIYVRLVGSANGCADTGQFEIRVELPPVAVLPAPLQLCDDDVADEITVFDLTVRDAQITGGEGSWSVSYYETLAQANGQTGAIADPTAYTNTTVGGAAANPQTLYAVVTDTDTGCTDITTLTIRVLPNPTPTTDLPELVLCDDTAPGDLQEPFDLTINESLLINGEDNVTASYHTTAFDADQGTNAIADPTAYENTATPQVVYARVTNDLTGCYTVVEQVISVDPLPALPAGGVDDLIACELATDGLAPFFLSDRDLDVLDGQDPALFTVSYHIDQADADNLEDGLVSPYVNVTNPQQIFVAVTNNDTGCSISTLSFNIEVQEGAAANADMADILYETCDDEMEFDGDPGNDSAQFDLTPVTDVADLVAGSVQAEVLDGQDPAGYTVSYYASEADAALGQDPLPFLYENLVNPQVIWARVDNDTEAADGTDSSICYALAPVTLQVNPMPSFDLEDSYVLCVGTDGTEVIGAPVLDTGLTSPDYEFEWTFNGTVIAGADGGSYMPQAEGTYGVSVTDVSTSLVTSCVGYDQAEVIESGPPAVSAEVLTDGFADLHVVEVTVAGDGSYEYSLDGGPWQDSPVFSDVSLGDHELTARDRNGCGLASTTVTVLDYPAFFTPNGDGYNDTWNIAGISAQGSAKIFIFDRFGKLLKQLDPTGAGWDGSYNGTAMPNSDYWFVVEYQEPNTGASKEFKAHFTLKR